MKPGARNLITDVAGLRVGNAQDRVLKSGATVLTADMPFVASVHVMGGAPGTRETDLLAPDKSVEAIDAIVLSGGSAFGLDACGGVAARLRADGRGFPVGPIRVPIVPGAIIFDLINGGEKNWDANPYVDLGGEAYKAAAAEFDLGSVGGGTGAMTAMHMGGLGSASYVLDSGYTVGALVVVNAVGSVTTPGTRHFWAAPFEESEEFGGLGPSPNAGMAIQEQSRKSAAMMLEDQPQANTTIAIVATDAPLTKTQCHRMAVVAHDGIARAIVPAHTPADGDLVFALSHSPSQRPVEGVAMSQIGTAAAHCLSRAIARGVHASTPSEGDLIPCWSTDLR